MKLFLTIATLFVISFHLEAQPVRIMLITGGHSFDTLQFFQLFDSLEGVNYTHFSQPEANQAITDNVADDFDVLVFYDMWRNIDEPAKAAYLDLTKLGKSFLFLHHSMVSYQNWPEFEILRGGSYIQNQDLPEEQQSTYRHDVWVDVEIVDPEHPVTQGMANFRLFDEVYGNYRVMPGVKPLLKTNHPESSPVIAWENKYNSSYIITLQPGHDKNAYKSENYRKLLVQSIKYLAGKNRHPNKK
jgi:uncharacterized protein